MDWTGYPKNLDPDDKVKSPAHLARFLGGEDDSVTGDLVRLIARGDDHPGHTTKLAAAFPREVVAFRTWRTLHDPTGAELVDALIQQPDAPAEAPDGLLPIMVQRAIVLGLDATAEASVTARFRLDRGAGWTQAQFLVPTPAIEIDPRLLTDPDGARLTMRLTVAAPDPEPDADAAPGPAPVLDPPAGPGRKP